MNIYKKLLSVSLASLVLFSSVSFVYAIDNARFSVSDVTVIDNSTITVKFNMKLWIESVTAKINSMVDGANIDIKSIIKDTLKDDTIIISTSTPLKSSSPYWITILSAKNSIWTDVWKWVDAIREFKTPEKKVVKKNGYDTISKLIFSPDWKSFVYVTKDWKDISLIIKDWVEIWKWYEFIFSPDSKSFAYVKEYYKDWKYSFIKDWVEWNKYSLITNITLSLNSKNF